MEEWKELLDSVVNRLVNVEIGDAENYNRLETEVEELDAIITDLWNTIQFAKEKEVPFEEFMEYL